MASMLPIPRKEACGRPPPACALERHNPKTTSATERFNDAKVISLLHLNI